MTFNDKKYYIRKYSKILSCIYRTIHWNNKSVKSGNLISYEGVFLRKCTFHIVGTNNRLIIDPGITRLFSCNFYIKSSNCEIRIGADCNLHNTSFYIEDDGGSIIIGKHVTITGNTNLDVIEGKNITIGDDCLFSSNIQIRVGDSHSIIDQTSRKRINPSKDVVLGNHVWVGNGVEILKGARIGDNSIIGTRALVTGKEYPSYSIIGGIPAKVLKEGVTWDAKRIPEKQNMS